MTISTDRDLMKRVFYVQLCSTLERSHRGLSNGASYLTSLAQSKESAGYLGTSRM